MFGSVRQIIGTEGDREDEDNRALYGMGKLCCRYEISV